MTPPKVFVYDEEWFPHIGYAWDFYDTNLIKVVRPAYMLSFSVKEIGGKHITKGLCDYKGYRGGPAKEEQLARDLWAVFDEADVLVAHNGDKFDDRKAKALFYKYKLGVPSPYKTVDTMKIWSKNFETGAKSLKHIAEYADIQRKKETDGFPLWEGCDRGEAKAWKKMLAYNRQDVIVTEQLYLSLLPWIQSHPTMSFNGDCANCGGKVFATTRTYMTRKGEKTRYQCSACGHWS